VATVVIAGLDDDAGSRRTEAHKLTLVGRAEGPSGAAEVERFQEVCLAGAVGAVD